MQPYRPMATEVQTGGPRVQTGGSQEGCSNLTETVSSETHGQPVSSVQGGTCAECPPRSELAPGLKMRGRQILAQHKKDFRSG